MPTKRILNYGQNIFSYKALPLMERSLIVSNIYHGGNHPIERMGFFINIGSRKGNIIYTNNSFEHKGNINPVAWYTYQYRNNTIDIMYPRKYFWMEIIMPNNRSVMSYLPEIVSPGDTLIVEAKNFKRMA